MRNKIFRFFGKTFYFVSFSSLLFLTSCFKTEEINPDEIVKIDLINVNKSNSNKNDSVLALDKNLNSQFIEDFNNRNIDHNILKFLSYYRIRIYLKNGETLSYITNGVHTKNISNNKEEIFGKFNSDKNILTKYWSIDSNQIYNQSKPDTCNLCYFEEYNSVSKTDQKKKIISTPIAIEFFHLMDMIGKHDGNKELVDSLPKKLRNTGRQEIYKTIDQNGIYNCLIKPEIDSLKIKVIKGDYKNKSITFLINNKPVSFNLDYFQDNDGLLLYTPNKKPIIWTTESNNKNCDEKTFIRCYFSN